MATASSDDREKCIICDKQKGMFTCGGCLQKFCLKHLNEHCQQLRQKLNEIENDRNELQQSLIEQKSNRKKLSLIQRVDRWEADSINKIQQAAQECRQLLDQHKNAHILDMENKLTKLTEEMKQIRKDDEFNEIDLKQLQERLSKLQNELGQPRNIKIQEESAPFISKISVVVSSGKWSHSTMSDREPGYL